MGSDHIEEGDHIDWSDPDVVGRYVARARRVADLSQRALAARIGVSHGVIGDVESGQAKVSLALLQRVLRAANLRLVVVDASGHEVSPIPDDVVRDRAHRRYPAHHDVATKHAPPRWVRNDGRVAYQSVPLWGVRGAERDERRAMLGHDTPLTVEDHPSAAHLDQQARLARRFPRVLVNPPPREAIECSCPDACFERICIDDCPCSCESSL